MEGIKVLRSTQIIILGICFVVATIVSTVIFSQGLIKIKKFSSEVIKVTGSAEKNIVSDYMVWTLLAIIRTVPKVITVVLSAADDSVWAAKSETMVPLGN